MNLCLVHRDRRGALARIEPEFEKLRGYGVEVRTFNTDALAADKRGEILDSLAEALGENGRVRVLLHSIAFGNLKLVAPERRRDGSERARSALAASLGIDEAKLSEAADALLAEGHDALVGIATPPVYSDKNFLEAEDFSNTIHAMGTSLLDWTQDLLARGQFAEDARVFGLTSEGNTVAWKGYAAVAAAKVALESVARSIAVELAPYGVRCNVIQAGVTETPALAAIPGSGHLKAQARARNPFGRLTTPRDVARVIYLLSCDEAAWINGEVIRVDGGEHVSGVTG
ncbi:MAG: SDR family oxidoreductase [Deltaproteobacteria bacterium]|nr:SDR family oxidoreductase [Deltaproteobacteria bacterium]MBW2445179.1 SDR family oxidoreductase [Deltaproteobacteria bacterium]